MNAGNLFRGLTLDSEGFKQLLDSQSLVDCTLACDGGKISAHKVVLSACSSYLAKILQDHPVEHPIIILPELNIEDVKTLLHYMYTGELLKSETLNSTSLLRTAAILSVNSLNDFLNSTTGSAIQAAAPINTLAPNQLNAHQAINSLIENNLEHHYNHHQNLQHALQNTSYQQQMVNSASSITSSLQYFNSILSQAQQNAKAHNSHIDSDYLTSPNNIDNSTITSTLVSPNGGSILAGNSLNLNLNLLPNSNKLLNSANVSRSSSSSSEFQFKCPVCHNDFQTVCSFEYHMQRTHQVTSFACEICHKPFASLRYVLTDHMRRCHGWKADQKLHN